jgi:hypothetical protein
VLAVGAVPAAEAARAPTYLEKVTIMDAFNIPGRAFSSRCVKIVVSTADPRYALLTTPGRPPKACVSAGQVGDGFVLFRRAGPTALRWRDIYEGSAFPPCSLAVPVRRDLLGTTRCA